MDTIRIFLAAGAASLMALATSVPAAAADCSLLPDFNKAIQAGNIESAKAVEAQIVRDSACGSFGTAVVLQRTKLELIIAQALAGRPGSEAKREQLLLDADQPDVNWEAAGALGELRLSQKRYAEASGFFERAIEMNKNHTKTPAAPAANLIKRVLDRAAEARLLAANEEGRSNALYANATRDFRDGTIGGSFSEDVRGIKPTSVPLPINFETATDKPTAIGLKAATELLEAIQDQRPDEILIVGHTDERGADNYNMRLSEARARAVARFLASNGVAAKITILARGWHEPLKLDAADKLSEAEIWALNRRVEWRRPER